MKKQTFGLTVSKSMLQEITLSGRIFQTTDLIFEKNVPFKGACVVLCAQTNGCASLTVTSSPLTSWMTCRGHFGIMHGGSAHVVDNNAIYLYSPEGKMSMVISHFRAILLDNASAECSVSD